jgi:hypothetical protein
MPILDDKDRRDALGAFKSPLTIVSPPTGSTPTHFIEGHNLHTYTALTA